jgi:hypothetical protein
LSDIDDGTQVVIIDVPVAVVVMLELVMDAAGPAPNVHRRPTPTIDETDERHIPTCVCCRRIARRLLLKRYQVDLVNDAQQFEEVSSTVLYFSQCCTIGRGWSLSSLLFYLTDCELTVMMPPVWPTKLSFYAAAWGFRIAGGHKVGVFFSAWH